MRKKTLLGCRGDAIGSPAWIVLPPPPPPPPDQPGVAGIFLALVSVMYIVLFTSPIYRKISHK